MTGWTVVRPYPEVVTGAREVCSVLGASRVQPMNPGNESAARPESPGRWSNCEVRTWFRTRIVFAITGRVRGGGGLALTVEFAVTVGYSMAGDSP